MSNEVKAGPVAVAPQKVQAPRTAIQIIETDIQNYIRQREQLVSNVHAVEGAIQASQNLLARLKAEEERAKALASGTATPAPILDAESQAKLEEAVGAPVEVLGVVDNQQ